MPTPIPLKATVMGAGAVGCYYGGMLARAGHDVTLVARPPHAEAIARQGLRMETRTFDGRVRLRAVADRAAAVLVACPRLAAGRKRRPTAAIIATQSVKTDQGRRGKGRKSRCVQFSVISPAAPMVSLIVYSY